MQSILFLNSPTDGKVNRIINIDLMATAHPHPVDPNATEVLFAGVQITIGQPFDEFIENVQKLIAENYRISHETSIRWHEKRQKDMEGALSKLVDEIKR